MGRSGQHSIPTNENHGRPWEMFAWRIWSGVRGEDVDDADGSAAFVAGWEEGDEDMLQKVRMRCDSVADRLPTALSILVR